MICLERFIWIVLYWRTRSCGGQLFMILLSVGWAKGIKKTICRPCMCYIFGKPWVQGPQRKWSNTLWQLYTVGSIHYVLSWPTILPWSCSCSFSWSFCVLCSLVKADHFASWKGTILESTNYFAAWKYYRR